MASMKIRGKWLDVLDYKADANGTLLSATVANPDGQNYNLVFRPEEFGFLELLKLVGSVVAGMGVGGKVGSSVDNSNTDNIVTGTAIGAVGGLVMFMLTIKEDGYIDIGSKTLLRKGKINIHRTSSAFSTA